MIKPISGETLKLHVMVNKDFYRFMRAGIIIEWSSEALLAVLPTDRMHIGNVKEESKVYRAMIKLKPLNRGCLINISTASKEQFILSLLLRKMKGSY